MYDYLQSMPFVNKDKIVTLVESVISISRVDIDKTTLILTFIYVSSRQTRKQGTSIQFHRKMIRNDRLQDQDRHKQGIEESIFIWFLY